MIIKKTRMNDQVKRSVLFFTPIIIVITGVCVIAYATRQGSQVNVPLAALTANPQVKTPLEHAQLEQFFQARTRSSDLVIVGYVEMIETRKEENGLIFTYVTIAPTDIIKGKVKGPIIIRHVGGTIGNSAIHAYGDVPEPASWKEGAEELLFLEYLTDLRLYISGSSGKFDLIHLPDGAEAFRVPPEIEISTSTSEAEPSFSDPSSEPLYLAKEATTEYVRTISRTR